jgi:hypothetical protein
LPIALLISPIIIWRRESINASKYFIKADHFADLEWTQEVATRLLQVVQAHVAETVECGPPNPRVVKFSITLSKPVKQQKSSRE